ncbi:peptide-methionine (S)-S-oxide reductase [Virgibacillus phasianinus]|uniref:Peptide methionine sulfoxide reductase MsrA n=1 Tax=Virgibacillus phasianinus TaxID=2017483 RepID=A0A220TZH7_9BACI|nr:peptide-methionine (S)-S-oxide reductase MsrA [Virgibacillus phasianinus]ASK61189.1 peptide-methionine (S)-S-oxide reductase [Virgibacillus phasianinus]
MGIEKQKATFAGGCFWCMVKPFDTWDGVYSVVSGYTGGDVINPTYEEVKTGQTGHYEAVEITFDPEVIAYEKIMSIFWQQIDPTDDGGQFQDRGDSYRTAIFYHNDAQRIAAETAKTELEHSGKFKKPIVTKILPAVNFYTAEDYHQDFYKTNEQEYKKDRSNSGRDEFIEKVWKKD